MGQVKFKDDMKPQIAEAMRSSDLTDFACWNDLDALSSETHVANIEVFDEEIMLSGESFEGSINVYLTLNYGSGDDATWISAAFPGSFSGVLQDGQPVISNVIVDTSSFYA